jgi:trans-aconitate methyltransferase
MVDPAVLRRFSAVAARYDAHARAQRRSARDLLAFTLGSLPSRRSADPPDAAGQGTAVFRILEPGCGTGLYTRMLLDAFPGASVFGVDVSEPQL